MTEFDFSHFPENQISRDENGRVIAVGGILVDPEKRAGQSSDKTREMFGPPDSWESVAILPRTAMELGVPVNEFENREGHPKEE